MFLQVPNAYHLPQFNSLDLYLLALLRYLFFGIVSKASTQFPAQPQAVWQDKVVNVLLRVTLQLY
jgi:hypothetical protein